MINNNSKKSQTGLNNFDNIKDTQETGNTRSHGEKLLSCLEQSHPAEHSWGQPSLQQIHSCVNVFSGSPQKSKDEVVKGKSRMSVTGEEYFVASRFKHLKYQSYPTAYYHKMDGIEQFFSPS